ncbi:ankyrin repeat domain-containing protein [Halobaculum sp. MBLA0147]|uniref:ankyrin repeat domain-containing protein n=1 Tax=Halobaculum sp. MBLA0147 TaxID=3079934 RepID=UPI003525FAE6
MTDDRDDLYRRTDIESAIVQGDKAKYDELIDDANLDHRGGGNNTLLHEATIMGRTEIVADLLERGIDIDAVNDGGKTVLHRAIEEDYPEIAHTLLDNGARVDIADVFECEPLQRAVSNTYYDLTERILERGGDPTHENEVGISPLSLAREGWPQKYVDLLESYADEDDR